MSRWAGEAGDFAVTAPLEDYGTDRRSPHRGTGIARWLDRLALPAAVRHRSLLAALLGSSGMAIGDRTVWRRDGAATLSGRNAGVGNRVHRCRGRRAGNRLHAGRNGPADGGAPRHRIGRHVRCAANWHCDSTSGCCRRGSPPRRCAGGDRRSRPCGRARTDRLEPDHDGVMTAVFDVAAGQELTFVMSYGPSHTCRRRDRRR